jgi:hypothetical protein
LARLGRSERFKVGLGNFEYLELISRQSGYFARIGNDMRDATPNRYGFCITVAFAACFIEEIELWANLMKAAQSPRQAPCVKLSLMDLGAYLSDSAHLKSVQACFPGHMTLCA